MDASSLLFVALAVAWAAYLIPKALHAHDDGDRTRSVDRFSHRMRVLARREPTSRRDAQLVVTQRATTRGGSDAAAATSPVLGPSPAEIRARRDAARRAARRRRRVLLLLLVASAATAGVAASGYLAWWYVAIPAGLLVAWLVACRVMVRGEHRAWDRLVTPPAPAEPAAEEPATPAGVAGAGIPDGALEVTSEVAAVAEPVDGLANADPGQWDPVPMTLPTYVSKPAARRTVRTIDLESTGVWTSGRTEADAALAREADAADAAARAARDDAADQASRRAAGDA